MQNPETNLIALLEQREEQFAYDVVAGTLGRSIAANAQIDLLFVALMAAVAAMDASRSPNRQYSRTHLRNRGQNEWVEAIAS